MPRMPLGALLCAFVSACRGPAAPQAGAELSLSGPAETPAPKDEVAAEAIKSIEEGDFERARELMEPLLLTDALARARAALAAGRPEDALAAVDRALQSAPENAE